MPAIIWAETSGSFRRAKIRLKMRAKAANIQMSRRKVVVLPTAMIILLHSVLVTSVALDIFCHDFYVIPNSFPPARQAAQAGEED
jgi:hypothetical protein